MIFAAIGYWGIGLPLGVAAGLPLRPAGDGIWIGLSAGLGVVAVLLLVALAAPRPAACAGAARLKPSGLAGP